MPRPADSASTVRADTAAEDAAYLQVIALLRAGKQDEARAAARSYLERFPNGFRRDEMIRVASGGAQP